MAKKQIVQMKGADGTIQYPKSVAKAIEMGAGKGTLEQKLLELEKKVETGPLIGSATELKLLLHSGYIDIDGKINSSSNFSYSSPILLDIGERIEVSAVSLSEIFPVVTETDEIGAKYKSLVKSSPDTKTVYAYTANKRIYVSVCGKTSNGDQLTASVLSAGSYTIEEKINELDKKTSTNGIKINSIEDKINNISTDISKLFVWTNGGFIQTRPSSDVGNIWKSKTSKYSNYVEIGEQATIEITIKKLSGEFGGGLIFCDADKKVIKAYNAHDRADSDGVEIVRYTSPIGTRFVRTSFWDDRYDYGTFSCKVYGLEYIGAGNSTGNKTDNNSSPKAIKLIDIENGTAVTGVGDVYYSAKKKQILKCTSWNSYPSDSTFEKVNVTESDLFIYNDTFFIWNGAELVCTDLNFATGGDVLPQNIGEVNMLMNAMQLKNIRFTPVADIPNQAGISANQEVTSGMLYSSTRLEDNWVPQNVSLHTFMSALTDKNSKIYKIDTSKPPYNLNNSACYYGTVCSQFVMFCLDIDINYQTRQIAQMPGVFKVGDQSINGAHLGDILLEGGYENNLGSYGSGHGKIITAIKKNEFGRITEVTSMESVQSGIVEVKMNKDEFDRLLSTYRMYRYKYLYRCKHQQSPFVTVLDEAPIERPVFNPNLMPDRGDKANYHKNEHVVIDIIKKASYTEVELYKDGSLSKTVPISADTIDLGVLPYGSYKARLGGYGYSDYVYFMVLDYNVSVANDKDGYVKVGFSSANATPIFLSWNIISNSFPTWYQRISDNDRKNGYTLTRYRRTNWGFKVYFKTEFGITCSEIVKLNVS